MVSVATIATIAAVTAVSTVTVLGRVVFVVLVSLSDIIEKIFAELLGGLDLVGVWTTLLNGQLSLVV